MMKTLAKLQNDCAGSLNNFVPHKQNICDRDQEYQILKQIITSFNATGQRLEQSYEQLQIQIRQLNKDLEEKNQQLAQNLREIDEVKCFLASILESLPIGVMVTDLQGRLLSSNNSVEKITGLCPATMEQDSFTEWLGAFGINPLSHGDWTALQTLEVDFCRSSAGVRHLKVSLSPVLDKEGAAAGRLIILQDQTRLKKLEVQSERNQRLQAMGEMAISIAHEVRNPLGSIELFASMLRRELNEKPDLQKMTEHIMTEIKSLDHTLSNLLLFTRPQDPVMQETDIAALIDEFIGFIKPIIRKNGVTLSYKPWRTSLVILADKDLIKQVLLNLTLNALQAMQQGGVLEVQIHLLSEEDPLQRQWIEITFRDQGAGIKKEELKKIFHPFYTTKQKGTGLGLAIVHNIIESHKGTIEVNSQVGQGSSFIISLPLLKYR